MSGAVNDPASAAAKATGGIPEQVADVDCSKLNALSPEVIARQATVSYDSLDDTQLIRLDQHRYHWSCRTRKVVHSPSRLWSHYYSIQERVGTKYYHQAWLRKCQGQSFYFGKVAILMEIDLQVPEPQMSPSIQLPIIPFQYRDSPTLSATRLWRNYGPYQVSHSRVACGSELMIDTFLSSIVQVTTFSWLPC
jgi:hypothetical protein